MKGSGEPPADAPDAGGLVYSSAVLDHFQNPRNAGTLPDADLIGEAGNPACGDRMRLFLKLEGGHVTAARFQTFGCSVAIAASSMLTELVQGRDLEGLARLKNEEIVAALGGLPARKAACSVLAEAALQDALSRAK